MTTDKETKRRRVLFWTILILMDVSIVLACAGWFFTNYLTNIEKMAMLCESAGVKYMAALQPWRDFDEDRVRQRRKVSATDIFYHEAIAVFEKWQAERKQGAAYASLAGVFAERPRSVLETAGSQQ